MLVLPRLPFVRGHGLRVSFLVLLLLLPLDVLAMNRLCHVCTSWVLMLGLRLACVVVWDALVLSLGLSI